ncbi:MAG: hypothetical protein H7258_01995 [Ferruginibacter sp.]|nr:hypothetical protein [Ferruginibacter sp.]
MQKLCLALFISTLFCFSCKKDKTTADATKINFLTQNGGWFETNVLKRSAPTDPWEVDYFSLEPCNLDNRTSFTSTYSFIIDGGSEKCNPSDPQLLGMGTFGFTNDQTHLSVIKNLGSYNQTQDWTILQLDADIFVYEYYYPVGGPYYKVTMTH